MKFRRIRKKKKPWKFTCQSIWESYTQEIVLIKREYLISIINGDKMLHTRLEIPEGYCSFQGMVEMHTVSKKLKGRIERTKYVKPGEY